MRNLTVSNRRKYTDMHFHKEVELVYVKSGQIGLWVDNQDIVLNENQAVFINREVIHKLYFYGKDAKCIYLQIDMDNYNSQLMHNENKYLTQFLSGKNTKSYGIYGKNSELFDILSGIVHECTVKKAYFEEYVTAHVYHLAAYMLRSGYSNSIAGNNNQLNKILPAVHYVENNFKTKIYLDYVAEHLNLDKYYFCKLFKSITKASFVDYVNFVRLCKAQELLTDGAQNVSEIAFECGFSSVQYFNRVFKESKGCTPKEYRNMFYKII